MITFENNRNDNQDRYLKDIYACLAYIMFTWMTYKREFLDIGQNKDTG